jgi:alpha-glucosidase
MHESTGDLTWWQRGVIYQIYPRSFKDTTGNGVGDLQGVIDKLDYLDGLEIEAIWLSPFYPSPMADFGYDVADYCDVDPLFGDLATFDRLVEGAHARGIKVIIDWVPNHSSDEHPWFRASRSSLDDPKRDWYIWRDPAPDGGPPNNWASFFGGPAWTYDEESGQYYLHQFAPEQPDLNWRNPEVREAMYDTLRFWLERGVDGFRMDVIGLIIKDAELRDNPPNPDAPDDLPEEDLAARQIMTYNLDQPEVHDVLREIRRVLDAYGEIVAIGELWFELPSWVRYYGEEGDELQLPINFRPAKQPWEAQAMRETVEEVYAALPDFAWHHFVLTSHDFARTASRFGGQGPARVAAMLLLTLWGTPTLYYGDELGLENGDIPPEKIQDPQGLNLGAERTRDVARTPMQWTPETYAGFCPAEVEPWLPVSDDYVSRNVRAQTAAPFSILNLYRALLRHRRRTPALHGGAYRSVEVEAGDCFVYLREAGDERRLVALNFSAAPRTVAVPGEGRGRVALSTHLDREEEVDLASLTLRPHEGVIVAL